MMSFSPPALQPPSLPGATTKNQTYLSRTRALRSRLSPKSRLAPVAKGGSASSRQSGSSLEFNPSEVRRSMGPPIPGGGGGSRTTSGSGGATAPVDDVPAEVQEDLQAAAAETFEAAATEVADVLADAGIEVGPSGASEQEAAQHRLRVSKALVGLGMVLGGIVVFRLITK